MPKVTEEHSPLCLSEKQTNHEVTTQHSQVNSFPIPIYPACGLCPFSYSHYTGKTRHLRFEVCLTSSSFVRQKLIERTVGIFQLSIQKLALLVKLRLKKFIRRLGTIEVEKTLWKALASACRQKPFGIPLQSHFACHFVLPDLTHWSTAAPHFGFLRETKEKVFYLLW